MDIQKFYNYCEQYEINVDNLNIYALFISNII